MSWRQVRLSPMINKSQVIGDCTAHGWEHGCVTSNARFRFSEAVGLLSFGMEFPESLFLVLSFGFRIHEVAHATIRLWGAQRPQLCEYSNHTCSNDVKSTYRKLSMSSFWISIGSEVLMRCHFSGPLD